MGTILEIIKILGVEDVVESGKDLILLKEGRPLFKLSFSDEDVKKKVISSFRKKDE